MFYLNSYPIPFVMEAIPIAILLGILAIILFLLIIALIKKYRQKPSNVTKYLLGQNISWFISSITYFFGIFSWYRANERTPFFSISLPIAYSSLLFASFFMLLFTFEIIKIDMNKRNKIVTFYLIYIICLASFFFNFGLNKWGAPPPIPLPRLILLLIFLVGTVITYISLLSIIIRVLKRIDDELYKNSLKYLLYYILLSFSYYLFAIISEIHLMFIANPPLYGPFEYMAFIMAIVSMIYGNIGITMPQWFKKRFTHVDH